MSWISLAPSIFDPLAGVQYDECLTSTSPISVLKAAWKVRRLIKDRRPDILHVHSVGTYGLLGTLSGFHPVVMTAWGSDVLLGSKSLVKKPLVAWSLRHADLLTCDAVHMRHAITDMSVDARKIALVYFGIDTRQFSPREKNIELRKRLQLDDAPTVISLRSLEPIYDVESLVASVPLVVKEIPQARFVIAGKGSEEHRLKQLAGRLGVAEHIRFVGFIANHELPVYLTSMDVYVSTSLSDAGIAASTAEAMACGLPVVVTDTGENKKWIADGESGFVVSSRSPDRLADRIIRLLKDRDLRVTLGSRARVMIQEQNDYEKEMSKMESLYAELARRG